MWLWGLLLALAGAAYGLHARGARFGTAILLAFVVFTGALGLSIFYGCYRWAPYSMGLGAPGVSAAGVTTFMCLSKSAFATALMWTVIVLSCSAAVGLVAWTRLRAGNAVLRVSCFIGAVLLLLVAIAAGFFLFFGISWCLSQRLF
ncbi:MAG: hypothetical protein WB810_04290 [Candidatus Cybelea sp.]